MYFCDGLINNTAVCLYLDLYYNENYAGLAAEIFGLAEATHMQSDDSTDIPPENDAEQLPACAEEVGTSESAADMSPVDPTAIAAEADEAVDHSIITNSEPTVSIVIRNLITGQLMWNYYCEECEINLCGC